MSERVRWCLNLECGGRVPIYRDDDTALDHSSGERNHTAPSAPHIAVRLWLHRAVASSNEAPPAPRSGASNFESACSLNCLTSLDYQHPIVDTRDLFHG